MTSFDLISVDIKKIRPKEIKKITFILMKIHSEMNLVFLFN